VFGFCITGKVSEDHSRFGQVTQRSLKEEPFGIADARVFCRPYALPITQLTLLKLTMMEIKLYFEVYGDQNNL